MDIGNLSSTDVIFQGFPNDTKLALNRVWENYNNPNPNPNTKPCNLVEFLKNSNFSKYTHEIISHTDIQFFKICHIPN